MNTLLVRRYIRGILAESIEELFNKMLYEGSDLSVSEMNKYGAERWKKFLNKFDVKDAFSLKDGTPITIPRMGNENLFNAVSRGDAEEYKAAFKTGVTATENNAKIITLKSPKELQKTADFGGRGAGSGNTAEIGQIGQINTAIETAKAESESDSIDIFVCGGPEQRMFENITACIKINGTPKADAALVNINGDRVAYFSLKAADGPKGMNQWGGVSKIGSEQQVQDFAKDVNDWLKSKNISQIPQGIALVSSQSLNGDLAINAIYGSDSGGDVASSDNCDFIVASKKIDLVLEAEREISDGDNSQPIYRLSGANIWCNPIIPDGLWEPRLAARRGDRDDLNLPGTRVGIFPLGYRSQQKVIFI